MEKWYLVEDLKEICIFQSNISESMCLSIDVEAGESTMTLACVATQVEKNDEMLKQNTNREM